MEFIDFGCGRGDSMGFAHRTLSGEGVGIDKSKDAVEATRARGFEAKIGDVTKFTSRNVAPVSLSVDLMQELANRSEFEAALKNIIAACTNCAVIQHSYFDLDGILVQSGAYIKQNFNKKILFKPLSGDYANFAKRHLSALNLVGMAVFGFGSTGALNIVDDLPLEGSGEFRSMRVVLGRKDIKRFRRGLELFGTGQALFTWEAA